MSLCNALVGIPLVCEDNNQGGIKRALIADFKDVESVTEAAGVVSAITMDGDANFHEFAFKKDTSSFAQTLVQDLVADTHGWAQTVVIGLRRISVAKRNAIMLLASGRRDLMVIVEDWNGDYWLIGRHQGVRLTANELTTNETRAAGQQLPITLSGEYEPAMMYKVNADVIDGLLP